MFTTATTQEIKTECAFTSARGRELMQHGTFLRRNPFRGTDVIHECYIARYRKSGALECTMRAHSWRYNCTLRRARATCPVNVYVRNSTHCQAGWRHVIICTDLHCDTAEFGDLPFAGLACRHACFQIVPDQLNREAEIFQMYLKWNCIHWRVVANYVLAELLFIMIKEGTNLSS